MALSRTQFCVLLTLLWGLFAYGSIDSAGESLQGTFTDASLIQLMLYELFAGGIVIAYLSRCGWRFSPAQLGVSWEQTGAGFLLYAISYLLHCLAWWLATALGGNAQPLVDLADTRSVSMPVVLLASVVNGTYEELVLIAFVFKALERHRMALVIGVSVLLRLLAHVYQGPVGALSILAFGLLMALAYLRFRQIWPLIVAHIVGDVLALAG